MQWKTRTDEATAAAEDSRRLAFAFASIALAARLARCGERLERETFLRFRALFPLEDDASAALRRLFSLAWADRAPAAYYASHIARLYPGRPDLRRELFSHLASIALSDGPLNEAETRLLQEIGKAWGMSVRRQARLIAKPGEPEPLKLLGLSKRAKPADIRARYRALMRHCHPDAGRFRYPEARAAAAAKAASLNAAYAKIMK